MKISRRAAALLAALPVTALSGFTASAQRKDVSSVMSTIETTLRSLTDDVADIVFLVIGIIGMIMAIPGIIKHLKGDSSSSDAFLKLGGGIVLAVIIVQICRLIIS